MAEAGKARGAVVGSKTQARRKALQDPEVQRPVVQVVERRHKPASLQDLVDQLPDADKVREAMGLGPAGGVELKAAQAGLAEFALPKDLEAMRPLMLPETWDRVLEERAIRMVAREAAERLEPAAEAFQRGYQASQWAASGAKAQGEAQGRVVGAGEQIKVHRHDLGLVGEIAQPEKEKGIWAELENLRWRVLRAHQAAEELGERMAGVLLPPEEKQKEVPATPAPKPLSRSSAEVALVAQSVMAVENLLTGLLARLDL